MNRGTYGTIKPANINLTKDVEIFYKYNPTRGTESDEFADGFKTLDTSCLVQANEANGGLIAGMYELRLPVDKFNAKGIYTVYIRPKEIHTVLSDVSVLSSYPDVKGIVIKKTSVNGETDLSGYAIEYLDVNGYRMDFSRVITSSNNAEPVIMGASDSYAKTTRWSLTDNTSDYLFCTVTPSSSTGFLPNAAPNIGYAGQNVVISNTKFSPVMLEIEMVENDADTLTTLIGGDQIRNRDKGLITTYDENGEISIQYEYYTLKDSLNRPLYDIKTKKQNPDVSEGYDTIITQNK